MDSLFGNTEDLQHELVVFIDTVMLPDAQIACSGNKQAATRLKKHFSHLRRLIRESKHCTVKSYPGGMQKKYYNSSTDGSGNVIVRKNIPIDSHPTPETILSSSLKTEMSPTPNPQHKPKIEQHAISLL